MYNGKLCSNWRSTKKLEQMEYTELNNTYLTTPKDDHKDRIEIEVGDSKQPEFYPQLKVMRWDNEVNVSLRLKTDIEQIPSKVGDKISTENIEFYALDEGYEFEVILKEKPKTNVIEFTIEDKGIEYFYQPELTQEEKDKGSIRPENVVGSYAVYASENKINYVGGKEYKCGKVGHIYRPKIIDAIGTEVWGELHIENGILSVTIPQEFLDKAVYPVRHAAGLTFGYTGEGASGPAGMSANNALAVRGTPASTGTVSKISAYVKDATGQHYKGVVTLQSTHALLTNGIAAASDAIGASLGWIDSSFATPPAVTASTEYEAGIVIEGSSFYIAYDTGGSDTTWYQGTNSYSSPGTLATGGTYAAFGATRTSIYATYTAGGDGSTSPSISPSESPSTSPSASPSTSPSTSPSPSVSPSASPSPAPEEVPLTGGVPVTIPEVKKQNIYVRLSEMCYVNLTTQEFVVALSKGKSFIPFEEVDNFDVRIGDSLIQFADNETAMVFLEKSV